MFIYNVTIQVDHSIHEQWVEWMKNKHIPEVMQSGCFSEYRFLRLLEIDESEGFTYSAQYHAESKADYNRYIEIYAPALRQDATNTWGDHFIGFRSLLQVVN